MDESKTDIMSISGLPADDLDTRPVSCPPDPDDDFVPTLVRHESGIVEERDWQDLFNGNSCRKFKQAFNEDMPKKDSLWSSKDWSVSSCLKEIVSCRTYSLLIVFLLWANVARFVIYIGDPRVTLMAGAVPFLWYSTCALNASVLLVSCWNKAHFSAFFINWYLLFRDKTSRRLGLRGAANNSCIRYTAIMLWMAICLNVIATSYMMNELTNGLNLFLYIDGHRSTWSQVLSLVVTFFCSCAWLSPIVFIITLCRHIVAHFDHFKYVFRLHILAAGDRMPTYLSELRERHLIMCNLTAILDRYMKTAFAVMYSTQILSSCFILYQVISHYLDPVILFISCSWMAGGVVSAGIITYHASSVNVAMHSLTSDLHTVQTKDATQSQHTQLQLFLSKMSGCDLGFTVLGLITIKRELMLTLFGLFITYAVVLLQFKQS